MIYIYGTNIIQKEISHEKGIEDNPEFGKKMFEKKLGNRYYSFDHKGWHFIVLDDIYRGEGGSYIGYIDDKQIDWLKQDLEKTDKKTPVVLSVHIPFIKTRTQLTWGSPEAQFAAAGGPTNRVTFLKSDSCLSM